MDATTDLRTRLGPVGIWANFDAIDVAAAIGFAEHVERLGFTALWTNESTGREPFALLGALAWATSSLTLGLGVASIHARDATAAHNGARTVAELSRGRFVMGLGVSHRSSAGLRGHGYGPPIAAMNAYLDAYAAAPWTGPVDDDPPLVVAALGPRMLSLAAGRADGAIGYLVTVDQVARVRQLLDAAADPGRTGPRRTGPGPVLVVLLPAILGSGPEVDSAARATIGHHAAQPNYRANLLRAGFTAGQVDRLADPLVRAIVATGDAASLRARIAALRAAGADHVAVNPLSPAGRPADLATTKAIAPERT